MNGYNIIEVIKVLLPEFPVMKILLFRLKTNIPLGTVKQYLNPSLGLHSTIGTLLFPPIPQRIRFVRLTVYSTLFLIYCLPFVK